MKSLKSLSLLGCIIMFMMQCNSKAGDAHYQLISGEIKKHYKINTGKNDAENLIFINDKGCPNCIRSFSDYILNNVDRFEDNSLIFINSKGFNVDLERFAKHNSKNIIISHTIREHGNVLPDLGIIYLKKDKNKTEVDTIILIDPLTIKDQLNYIENRIVN